MSEDKKEITEEVVTEKTDDLAPSEQIKQEDNIEKATEEAINAEAEATEQRAESIEESAEELIDLNKKMVAKVEEELLQVSVEVDTETGEVQIPDEVKSEEQLLVDLVETAKARDGSAASRDWDIDELWDRVPGGKKAEKTISEDEYGDSLEAKKTLDTKENK